MFRAFPRLNDNGVLELDEGQKRSFPLFAARELCGILDTLVVPIGAAAVAV